MVRDPNGLSEWRTSTDLAEVTIELANNCFPLRLVVVNDLTAKAIIGLDFLEEIAAMLVEPSVS